MRALTKTLRGLMDSMECLLLFLKTVLLCWHPALSNFFVTAYQHFTFPSCWKYGYPQPVPKKTDLSNPSNYCPIALLSCHFKAFEILLNRKILKHLCVFNLLFCRHYGFHKESSTSDFAFLTDSWLSSLSRFGETFAVAQDMSKALDRFWHKSLLSKLPSFEFCPSVCTFIASVLSWRSVSAIVDGNCSTAKTIDSGFAHGFVLSPALFLLYFNHLSITNCLLLSYTLTPLHISRHHSIGHCSIYKFLGRMPQGAWPVYYFWMGQEEFVSFNDSNTHLLHLSTRQPPPDIYSLFLGNTLFSEYKCLWPTLDFQAQMEISYLIYY